MIGRMMGRGTGMLVAAALTDQPVKELLGIDKHGNSWIENHGRRADAKRARKTARGAYVTEYNRVVRAHNARSAVKVAELRG